MGATKKTRRYPRVGLPKEILVAWQRGAERIVSRVGTLGLGGLFISTPEPPAVGEIVKLFFECQGEGAGPSCRARRPAGQGHGRGIHCDGNGSPGAAPAAPEAIVANSLTGGRRLPKRGTAQERWTLALRKDKSLEHIRTRLLVRGDQLQEVRHRYHAAEAAGFFQHKEVEKAVLVHQERAFLERH